MTNIIDKVTADISSMMFPCLHYSPPFLTDVGLLVLLLTVVTIHGTVATIRPAFVSESVHRA